VSLLPGRAELLATLVASGRRIAICSSAPQVHVEAQAARLGVAAHLDQIWAGVIDKAAELPNRLEQWGARAEETLFAGDMTHDVEAARAAGVLSVATPSNYEPMERLLRSEPDLFMPDLNRLAAALGDARRFNEVFPLATVGALITNRAGQVLLVRTHKWSDRWGIPGGKIQRNESSEEALRRELLEETGLAVDDIRFVLVQDCVEPPEFERSAHFLLMNYVARVSQEDAEVRLNDEAEEWCWVTVEAALVMELNQPTRLLIDACVEQGMVG
jgi:ADP-ribose pyrophosphatase YjhB (NUDIX family)